VIFTSYNMAATNYNMSATGYNALATNYNMSATCYNTSATDYNVFATDYNMFATDYKRFATGYRTITTAYTEIAADYPKPKRCISPIVYCVTQTTQDTSLSLQAASFGRCASGCAAEQSLSAADCFAPPKGRYPETWLCHCEPSPKRR
jgi:hypothetical protein